MIHRFRRLGVVVLTIGCMCLVAACGSSSKSSSGSTGTNPAGHFAGFKVTSTQRACLKKKGVTIPTGGFRGGGHFKGGAPANGKFPKGKFPKGKFPKGKFPKGGTRPGGAGFGASGKNRAAFKACGVSFGGSPQGAGSSTTG